MDMITGLETRTFIGGTGLECGLREVKGNQCQRGGISSSGMMEVQELIRTAEDNHLHRLVFQLLQWMLR